MSPPPPSVSLEARSVRTSLTLLVYDVQWEIFTAMELELFSRILRTSFIYIDALASIFLFSKASCFCLQCVYVLHRSKEVLFK